MINKTEMLESKCCVCGNTIVKVVREEINCDTEDTVEEES